MTVDNNQSKYTYNGNGTTGPWNYPRYFIQDADLLVTKTSAAGVESTLTITTNYNVTGAGDPSGGFVTTTAVVAVGEKITVSGNVDIVQGDSYPETGLLPAKTVERGLDRLTMIAQQITEQIGRAPKLRLSTALSTAPSFDDPQDGKVPIFDSASNSYKNGPTATEISAAQGYATDTLGYKNDAQAAAAAAIAAAVNMKYRSARVATTANITLSGAQTIDGVAVIAGERVLVKNQSAPAENGIYVVAAGAWTRATDMDAWTEVVGAVVIAEEGSTLADTAWLCTSNQGGTLGTTAITFVDWGAVILGGGLALSKLATQAANTIVANATGSAASPTAVAIAANRFLARSSAGDMSAKTITDFALSLLDDTDATAARNTLGVFSPQIAGGRLTLTTGVPVTTGDVTAASTLYYTPYNDNRISLYDGFGWWTYSFSELSLALSGLTSGKPYDVFVYSNAGTPTLELTAWTNDTTRATALVYQDGILVKSGAATRRYLGTLYTTGTTTTEDSKANRYLWNYYNRIDRAMERKETTASWTYSTATFRQANGSTSNQLNFIIGVAEDAVYADLLGLSAFNSVASFQAIACGLGLDSTTVDSSSISGVNYCFNTYVSPMSASYRGTPSAGRHYIAWLEKGAGSNTQSWYSTTAGLVGTVRA